MDVSTLVVGVDGSASSIAAARTGLDIAERASGSCHLVHVATDIPYLPAWPIDTPIEDIQGMVTAHARARITDALEGKLPPTVVEQVDIQMGSPAWTLPRLADEHGADLVVLGGKHHAGPIRLLGGSVAHHMVRTMDRPILITDPEHLPITRVTAAVDLGPGSERVLADAVHVAEILGADLRALHVVEPLPPVPGSSTVFNHADYESWCRGAFSDLADTHVPAAEQIVAVGSPHDALTAAIEPDPYDLLVVGSHGKGFVERRLIGSVTHRLLTALPTSLLVIPLAEEAKAGRERNARAA